MKKKLQKSALAGAMAVVVGGAGIQDASADSLMFPYLAASATVTTIISVVHHGSQNGRQLPHTPIPDLHYAYFYKSGIAAILQQSECEEFNYFKPTSPEDLVTFDSGGIFGDAEGVMFNDPTNYTNLASPFNQPLKGVKPARAFLLVDDQTNKDAQLYGEALVMEFAGGAAWGYRAYNPKGGNFLNPDFGDGNDLQGEVVGSAKPPLIGNPLTDPFRGGEFAQFQFMPFDQVVTRFLITPVDGNQDRGNVATGVIMFDTSVGGQNIVAWDRDENPISGVVPHRIVCVAKKEVEEFMTAGAANNLEPKGGWSYLNTFNSKLTLTSGGDGAVIYKLEFGKGPVLDGIPLNGIFNNAIQLTDSGSITVPKTVGRRLGKGGTNGF